jgi:hypothetical protein
MAPPSRILFLVDHATPIGDPAMTRDLARRLLWIVVIANGVAMLTAVVPMLMPRSWIVWTHARLGMGEFPAQPIAEYLACLTSGVYAIFGLVLLICARDLDRYAAVITAIVGGVAVLSVVMLLYGLRIGIPTWWLIGDGVTAIGSGVIVLYLQRRARQ